MLSAGDQRFLLKLYGNLDQPDSVIFSPSDYQDLVRSNVAFSRFIEGLFFSRTMLFLGTVLKAWSTIWRHSGSPAVCLASTTP